MQHLLMTKNKIVKKMILDFTTSYAHKKDGDKEIRHIGDLRHKK